MDSKLLKYAAIFASAIIVMKITTKKNSNVFHNQQQSVKSPSQFLLIFSLDFSKHDDMNLQIMILECLWHT